MLSPKLPNDGSGSPKRPNGGPYNKTKAEELFKKYKTAGQIVIEQEQIEQFFADIGLNAKTDIVCLMVRFAMRCNHKGEVRLYEFLRGC